MKLLSILIPVYKTEKYVKRCLDSILTNMETSNSVCEVILVDDGSPDNSGIICDEYAEKHPDIIKVFHKTNEGTGATRNFLLDNACGEYVWFVDSDDTITENALTVITSLIKNHEGVDIISFCLRRFNVEGDYQPAQNVPTHLGEMSAKEYFLSKEFDGFMCNKIYRLEFLNYNSIMFNSQMICLEDMVFNLSAFSMCKRILITDILVYNYFQGNPSSTLQNKSREASDKKIKDNLTAQQEIMHLRDNAKDKVLKKSLNEILNLQVGSFIYAMFITRLPIYRVKEILRKLMTSGLYPVGFTYKRRVNIFILIVNVYPLFLILCWLHIKFK